MFGFSGIGETAINEFPPFWIDVAPKTCKVRLMPAYRLAEISIKTLYRVVIRILPD